MCIKRALPSSLKLTLAILKPDVSRNPFVVDEIHKCVLDNGFYFVRTNVAYLSRPEAEKFYDEHKTKFFFNRLVSFMCSGPITVHILAHENAIQQWRSLMGPTRVFKAQYEAPNTLRGRFGLTDTRNAVHGSDSPDSARREIGFFFPKFDACKWKKQESESFIQNQVTFDKQKCEHVIIQDGQKLAV